MFKPQVDQVKARLLSLYNHGTKLLALTLEIAETVAE
jgi:hypothetical protein